MNKKFIVQEVMLEKRYFPIIEDDEILKTALDKMNSFSHGIVCLINFKSELIGIITDGDIRRRLLSSQKPLSAMFVDDAIKHSIKSPITILNSTKLEDAVNLMEKKRIWDLPVINENNHLIGLLHLHNAIKKLL